MPHPVPKERRHAVSAKLLGALALAVTTAAAADPAQATPDVSPDAATGEWRLQIGALSWHSRQTRAPGRRWNSAHPGLGLEFRWPGLPLAAMPDTPSRWTSRLELGTLQDSREVWSPYGGLAVLYEVAKPQGAAVRGGLTAVVFQRSANWSGKTEAGVGLVPVLLLDHPGTRLGLAMTWLPRGVQRASDAPTAVLLQVNVRLGP